MMCPWLGAVKEGSQSQSQCGESSHVMLSIWIGESKGTINCLFLKF
jgi:hypothetical protein